MSGPGRLLAPKTCPATTAAPVPSSGASASWSACSAARSTSPARTC